MLARAHRSRPMGATAGLRHQGRGGGAALGSIASPSFGSNSGTPRPSVCDSKVSTG